jgi:hypothetical protein
MRRLILIVTTVALLSSTLGVSPALATPPTCEKRLSNGLCVIWASGGGHHGGGGGTHGGTQADCVIHTLGIDMRIPCTWRGLPFSNSLQCYVSVANPQPPASSPVWNGHVGGAIYNCRLPGSFAGVKSWQVWSATAPVGPDPGTLAAQAMRTLSIPAPVPGRYPAGRLQDGTPFTVVGAYTWYWTTRSSFRVLTATASAGGVSVQVRVTPTTLTFAPGDGSSAVSCGGPGSAWVASEGVWAPSPAGCDFRYQHSSIHLQGHVVTATYGIRWAINWTASTGQSGVLPDLTTTARSTFAVAEAESVVIG